MEKITGPREEKMVEVFSTDVPEDSTARRIISQLLDRFPHSIIGFDLQDCDKILRVEGKEVKPDMIIEIVRANGCQCRVLE